MKNPFSVKLMQTVSFTGLENCAKDIIHTIDNIIGAYSNYSE